jgi:hypothetical protein
MLRHDVLDVEAAAFAKDRHQALGTFFALVGESLLVLCVFCWLLPVADQVYDWLRRSIAFRALLVRLCSSQATHFRIQGKARYHLRILVNWILRLLGLVQGSAWSNRICLGDTQSSGLRLRGSQFR